MAAAMYLAMVSSTQGKGVLIADLAPEGPTLGETGGGGHRRGGGRKSDKSAGRQISRDLGHEFLPGSGNFSALLSIPSDRTRFPVFAAF